MNTNGTLIQKQIKDLHRPSSMHTHFTHDDGDKIGAFVVPCGVMAMALMMLAARSTLPLSEPPGAVPSVSMVSIASAPPAGTCTGRGTVLEERK